MALTEGAGRNKLGCARDGTLGKIGSSGVVASLLTILTCLGVVPAVAQEVSDHNTTLEPAVNTGLDPTIIPNTYGTSLFQAKFADGTRLRGALLQGVHHFGPDYFRVTVPVLDQVPGTSTRNYVTGMGDIRLDYFHIARRRTLGERFLHGLGATLQIDSASNSQLGAGTTVLEPFYAAAYLPNRSIRLVLVARYIRDIGAGFATPLRDEVLLSPSVIGVLPNAWYLGVRANHFLDLTSGPNTYTSLITIGKLFARHYNVGFFYEWPLTHESRLFNVQTRIGVSLLYQF